MKVAPTLSSLESPLLPVVLSVVDPGEVVVEVTVAVVGPAVVGETVLLPVGSPVPTPLVETDVDGGLLASVVSASSEVLPALSDSSVGPQPPHTISTNAQTAVAVESSQAMHLQ